MRTRPSPLSAWAVIGLVLVLCVAACSGGSAPPASAPAPTASTPVATAAPTAAPSAAEPSTAPESAEPSQALTNPSGVPVLNPEHCPATLPAAATATPDGIEIQGDDAFVTHAGKALDLLATKAPGSYADVQAGVSRVWQVESFS